MKETTKLRIGILAPTFLPIPSPKYGGTEQVVWHLADGLVDRGHDVTLFASGDAKTKAKLVPIWKQSFIAEDPVDAFDFIRQSFAAAVASGIVYEHAKDLDVLHSHVEERGLFVARVAGLPLVSTINGKITGPYQAVTYDYYKEVMNIAISHRHREVNDMIDWAGVVYNGVDLNRIPFKAKPAGDYLLFLGRISDEKDPASAIKIAQALGMRLVIAAKIDLKDRRYFESEVKPLLDGYKKAEFIGEVDFATKVKLYQDARATLFPIDWEEPFGLVMVESMAAGTPVIARHRGSVPEIVAHGVSGFVGETNEELIEFTRRVDEIDRAACRAQAEKFSADRMVEGYLEFYRRAIAQHAR